MFEGRCKDKRKRSVKLWLCINLAHRAAYILHYSMQWSKCTISFLALLILLEGTKSALSTLLCSLGVYFLYEMVSYR